MTINQLWQKILKAINRIPDLARYSTIVALAVFLSLLFPNTVKFNYDYTQGGRWSYSDLQAPFDFPLLKTQDELTSDIEKASSDSIPYYKLDESILPEQLTTLNEQLDIAFATLSKDYNLSKIDTDSNRKLLVNLLTRVYERGIIHSLPIHKKDKDDFVLNFVRKNTIEQRFAESFPDLREATQLLIDSLNKSGFQDPDFIISKALTKSIKAPNVLYNVKLSQEFQRKKINALSEYRGLVKAGEIIVLRDALIDSLTYKRLRSYEVKYNAEISQQKSGWVVNIGQILLIGLMLFVLVIYLRYYEESLFYSLRELWFLLSLVAIFTYMAWVLGTVNNLSIYLVPFCIVPIVIKNFYNGRLAIFTHLIVILLVGVLLDTTYKFIVIQVVAGVVTIAGMEKTRYLSQFFMSIFYILATYIIGFLSIEMLEKGVIYSSVSSNSLPLEGISWNTLSWMLLNIILTLLSYPLIPLLEKVFGFTSEITLVEFSDLNNPLLKRLSIEAPGTLQHSLQVANLSEAAASEIGANGLLVKVAALYHDIGKLFAASYFIENQQYGGNPHDDLDDLESAKIIISHVTEGVKLAKKYRLPKVVINFIASHHGTTRVEYFYRNYRKKNPDKTIDTTLFTYPGPIPKTKEEAILMMADTIEAASKSLKNPSEQDIDELIEKLITSKIEAGQLDDSQLSFKELIQVKSVFKKLLKSIYHIRIEYPEEQTNKNLN